MYLKIIRDASLSLSLSLSDVFSRQMIHCVGQVGKGYEKMNQCLPSTIDSFISGQSLPTQPGKTGL